MGSMSIMGKIFIANQKRKRRIMETKATALELISKERAKQKLKWSNNHDDSHELGDLRVVAATLCCEGTDAYVEDPHERGTNTDPWGLVSKIGYDEIKRLTVAAALIVAEIERLERLKDK